MISVEDITCRTGKHIFKTFLRVGGDPKQISHIKKYLSNIKNESVIKKARMIRVK